MMNLRRLSRSTCDGRPSRPANARGFSTTHLKRTSRQMQHQRQRERGPRVRYVVERMTMADIPRVVEIERLAYPSTWPPSAYRKELQDNPLAHYIVVRDTHIQAQPALAPAPADSGKRPFPLSLLPARPLSAPSPQLASIIGFSGLWLMVDEAHVTTIAMHPEHRGRGLGEFLLVNLIDISYNI